MFHTAQKRKRKENWCRVSTVCSVSPIQKKNSEATTRYRQTTRRLFKKNWNDWNFKKEKNSCIPLVRQITWLLSMVLRWHGFGTLQVIAPTGPDREGFESARVPSYRDQVSWYRRESRCSAQTDQRAVRPGTRNRKTLVGSSRKRPVRSGDLYDRFHVPVGSSATLPRRADSFCRWHPSLRCKERVVDVAVSGEWRDERKEVRLSLRAAATPPAEDWRS